MIEHRTDVLSVHQTRGDSTSLPQGERDAELANRSAVKARWRAGPASFAAHLHQLQLLPARTSRHLQEHRWAAGSRVHRLPAARTGRGSATDAAGRDARDVQLCQPAPAPVHVVNDRLTMRLTGWRDHKPSCGPGRPKPIRAEFCCPRRAANLCGLKPQCRQADRGARSPP